MRIVLAVLEVHDVVRDALARRCRERAREVIVLPSRSHPRRSPRAAADEDADAVVVGTYNGGALTLGRELHARAARPT